MTKPNPTLLKYKLFFPGLPLNKGSFYQTKVGAQLPTITSREILEAEAGEAEKRS